MRSESDTEELRGVYRTYGEQTAARLGEMLSENDKGDWLMCHISVTL